MSVSIAATRVGIVMASPAALARRQPFEVEQLGVKASG